MLLDDVQTQIETLERNAPLSAVEHVMLDDAKWQFQGGNYLAACRAVDRIILHASPATGLAISRAEITRRPDRLAWMASDLVILRMHLFLLHRATQSK